MVAIIISRQHVTCHPCFSLHKCVCVLVGGCFGYVLPTPCVILFPAPLVGVRQHRLLAIHPCVWHTCVVNNPRVLTSCPFQGSGWCVPVSKPVDVGKQGHPHVEP